VPALSYRWDFGDGTSEQGRQVHHAYTKAGNYTIRLMAEGMDGIPAEKHATISVSGSRTIGPPTRYNPD
jgi:PKD repeat protein